MDIKERQFEQMVKENKETIYTVCYMFSKDTDEVSDLFQEVLVNLWKGIDSFEHRSNVRTWIYRVALNTCISIDRKKSTCLRTRTTTHSKWACCTSASRNSNPSTEPSCCSGWRTSLTTKSPKLWASAPRMSQSDCSESRNN